MEDAFSPVLNALPSLVWAALPDGQIDFVNQRFCKYTGLTPAEASGNGWQTAILPEDLPNVVERWRSILASGETGEMEARLRRFDGEHRWFLISINRMRDEAGQVVKWFGVSTDIDDRKRAEEALHRRELDFRLIVDSIPMPVAVTTPTGEVEALNQPTLDYFGKTFEELKGWKSADVLHPDDLQNTIAAQMDAHQKGHPYNVESRHRRADGTYRWFNVLGLPLRDSEGNILRWFILQVNIDDRKRVEEALQSVERNLNLIINTIPTHIYVLNTEGSVQYVNQAVMDYTGLSLEDVKQEDYRDRVIHPEDFKRVRAPRAAGLRRGSPFSTEQRVLGNDGQYHWFLVHYKPLLDEHGRIVRWYVAAFDIEDRKRAEAQRDRTIAQLQAQQSMLSESEQRFRTIFDEAGVGIALVDLQQPDTPIQTNRALQTMLGLTQERLGFPETYNQLTADDDREADAATYRELGEGKRNSLRQEKHFILQDGSSVFANVIFTLLRDSVGLPRFVVAIHEDTTERRRAVERLQQKQELLDLAQKSARAMAFDWYIQQDVNFWSPEQEALYGILPGSFDGTYQSWKKLIYPPDWPLLLKAINHAQGTGEVAVEFRVKWPDGSLHWLATNGQMFFDDQGKPFRMVGFTSDVSRRKLVEEDLSRSEAFLAEAQRLSSIGSFSWRAETDDITWSEQLYRIYEFEIGVPVTLELIRTRVHPEDMSLFEKMIEKAREGTSEFEWQYRLLMPDNSIKHLHAVAHATRDQDGQLEYIAAVQDVTERRLSEEALGKLQSELAHMARVTSLGALTASIAHEVNQPLSGIITNASTCVRMLDADPPNIEGARLTAQRTIRDGHRAADVITQLRALFIKKEVTLEPVDLNEATHEVIALSLSELQRSRVVLQPELAGDLPLVAGDRVQLQQVILNLVRNASDAMGTVNDRPRQLLIKTEPDEDGQVRLSVQDVGIGFDPEVMNKLFDAFYTTKNEGMGIGLSVCRSIIANHHGRLSATLNDGPGATFSFSIPRAAAV